MAADPAPALTADEIAALRHAHRQRPDSAWCWACNCEERWPCPTIRALDELERLRTAGAELAHWLRVWVEEAKAAGAGTPCYSEAALAAWEAALGTAGGER